MNSDHTIVITGASLGIGRETALQFAPLGVNLALTYHKDKAAALDVAQQCLHLGAADVVTLPLDLTDNNSILRCAETLTERFPRITTLINNAGVVVWKRLEEQTFEEIDTQIQANLSGLIKFTQKCLPHISESIVNIASGAGKYGYDELTTYCATKFGVRGFSQALAREQPSLKIYSVNPGSTATRMTDFEGVSPKAVAEIIKNTAQGEYDVPNGGDIDVWKLLNTSL